jgi:hypothetical protein
MTVRTTLALVALAITSTAQAAPCAFEGDVRAYVGCIADQAWDSLELATSLADQNEGLCPDGWAATGGSCVDLTCRGVGEDVDAEIDNWFDARDRCTELGARLCSPSEISNTLASGCGFDAEFIAVGTADAGDERVFLSGKVHNSLTGLCTEDTYNGDFYAPQYSVMSSCVQRLMDANDDRVDGFWCCK